MKTVTHLKVYLRNFVGLNWRIYLAKSSDFRDQRWGFKLTLKIQVIQAGFNQQTSDFEFGKSVILVKHWDLPRKPATNMGMFLCLSGSRAAEQRWKCLEHCCASSLFGWTWPGDLLRPWAASLRWCDLNQTWKSYRKNGLFNNTQWRV